MFDKWRSFGRYPLNVTIGHTFNYYPLYQEIVSQKSKLRSRIDVTTMCLALQDLRCPYCRSLQKKLLPYREMKGVEEKWGVNAQKRHVMMAYKCKYVFLTRKEKDSVCNKPCNGEHCKYHVSVIEKRNKLANHKNELESPLKGMTDDEIANHTYSKCSMILKSGKSKGNACKCKCFKDGMCKRHYQSKLLAKDNSQFK